MKIKNLFYFFFISILPFKTGAFTLNNSVGAAFDNPRIVVNVANNNCSPNMTSTPEELLEISDQAIRQYWNTAPSSNLELVKGAVISPANLSNLKTDTLCSSLNPCIPNSTKMTVDGGITISCNTNNTAITGNFTSTSIAGLTLPVNISAKTINGSLVLLNGAANSSFQSASHDDKVAILAHEIGHAIGLGHSPVEDSLMYYQTVPVRRSLGWDDVDAVTYLYPALQPFAGNCGVIAPISKDHNFIQPWWVKNSFFLKFIGMLMILVLIANFLAFKFKRDFSLS